MATDCVIISALRPTSVNVRVFLHVRLLVEPLAAVLAGVRPRVRVDEQMRGERGRALECLPAHLALEAFLLSGDKEGILKSVTPELSQFLVSSSGYSNVTFRVRVLWFFWCFQSTPGR